MFLMVRISFKLSQATLLFNWYPSLDNRQGEYQRHAIDGNDWQTLQLHGGTFIQENFCERKNGYSYSYGNGKPRQ